MLRYKLEVMRRASPTKNTLQPVREFSFHAANDGQAIALTEQMQILAASDDCHFAGALRATRRFHLDGLARSPGGLTERPLPAGLA